MPRKKSTEKNNIFTFLLLPFKLLLVLFTPLFILIYIGATFYFDLPIWVSVAYFGAGFVGLIASKLSNSK
tara:strand:- start:379 stop:588 length:210 start_codon:yes stop_codon:yes gene_type:complete